jgi:hypothetical protein
MRAITTSILLAALVAVPASAAKPAAKAPAPKKPPAIQPEAIEALRDMSEFLREQKNFSVRTEMETDYVLDNGQKVRLESRGLVQVQRPSRLRAEIMSDRKNREFLYDGKTFTMFSPQVGYYAQLDAPPTILELADKLHLEYGVELPLVDLFRWGSDRADFADITQATVIGPSEIDDVKTNHYAYRQKGLDWQIWIESGDRPIPRKLVLTTTDDKARPEYAMEMTWQLSESTDPSKFSFVPPKDAMKISFEQLGTPKQDESRRAKRSARR